jgi:hypothetical protein
VPSTEYEDRKDWGPHHRDLTDDWTGLLYHNRSYGKTPSKHEYPIRGHLFIEREAPNPLREHIRRCDLCGHGWANVWSDGIYRCRRCGRQIAWMFAYGEIHTAFEDLLEDET